MGSFILKLEEAKRVYGDYPCADYPICGLFL